MWCGGCERAVSATRPTRLTNLSVMATKSVSVLTCDGHAVDAVSQCECERKRTRRQAAGQAGVCPHLHDRRAVRALCKPDQALDREAAHLQPTH